MKLDSQRQMSDSFRIAALLAVVGGFLDAYTYVARGGVFANAQTGNIVLFGLSIAEKNWINAISYFVPILAFVSGIFLDEWIRKRFLPGRKIHWRQIIIIFEIITLCVVAWLPQNNSADMIANTLVSFVCSMQTQSFRKVHGLPYASTMCTGNLRSGTELLFQYTQTKDRKQRIKSLHYYGVIGFFILGAGIGALVTKQLSASAAIWCNTLLLLVYFLLFRQH